MKTETAIVAVCIAAVSPCDDIHVAFKFPYSLSQLRCNKPERERRVRMIWCRACGCLASQLLAVSGLGDSAFGAAGGGGDIPAGGARRGSQGERAGGGWHGGQRWADDVKRWVWAPKSCADCSGRWDRCEETAGSFKCLPCDSAAECGSWRSRGLGFRGSSD
jgi:hypothetical protein